MAKSFIQRHRAWVVLGVLFALVGLALGCAPSQRWLDRQGLKDYARELESRIPDTLEAPRQEIDLEPDTRPHRVTWKVGECKPPYSTKKEHLKQEVWTYEATSSEGGQPTFYVFRHGELGARPVVIWLPGNGFAPIAFWFVQHFYETILDRGFDLVIWVPPHHFERKTATSPPSLFGPDTATNQRLILASVREVRTLIAELRRRNTPRIGGWGGSMGAAILWLASVVEELDHISMMIPVVDWRTLTVEPAEMNGLTGRIVELGVSEDVLGKAYLSISPVNFRSQVSPERIQIHYAVYDQLTPESRILDFARQNAVERVRGFDRSHATILLTPSLYADYDSFLGSLSPPL